MLNALYKSTLLLTVSVIVCCSIFMISVWTVKQEFFPVQAKVATIDNEAGQAIDSVLIAQKFTQDIYFQPHPSAAEYDTSASASVALAASNHALRERVATSLARLKATNDAPTGKITTVASGVDPHITVDSAMYQLDRVALAWASVLKRKPDDMRNEIQHLIHDKMSAPLMGLAGEEIVNVFEINLALQKKYGTI